MSQSIVICELSATLSGMQITDVKIRPIQKGFIVSHYHQQNSTQDSPFPGGDHVEEFHADAESAAARMAELAGKMKKPKYVTTPSGTPVTGTMVAKSAAKNRVQTKRYPSK